MAMSVKAFRNNADKDHVALSSSASMSTRSELVCHCVCARLGL